MQTAITIIGILWGLAIVVFDLTRAGRRIHAMLKDEWWYPWRTRRG